MRLDEAVPKAVLKSELSDSSKGRRAPLEAKNYKTNSPRGCTQCLRGQHLRLRRGRAKAYIAILVDVEKPEEPKLDQIFTADGKLNPDSRIKIGMVDASAFAFVADGRNGLRLVGKSCRPRIRKTPTAPARAPLPS